MGLPTGFLEIERKDRPYEKVEKRLKSWKEFVLPLPPAEVSQQGARCMDCGIPFCHNGCPVNNLIPDWNELVRRDRWQDALEVAALDQQFPGIHRPHLPGALRGGLHAQHRRQPGHHQSRSNARSSIAAGKRAGSTPLVPARKTGKRVAVVGSGPAGMACAQQLARAGHAVTLFEKADRIGGLLRYGIPDFKMEKRLIDRRMRQMEAEGVEFRTGVEVGATLSIKSLLEGYDAVALTGGAEWPRDLEVPGRELSGIHYAMDFLVQQNKRVAGDDEARAAPKGTLTAKGKHVVVIGGGDTGSDCVGTSNRQGAASVTQLEVMPQPPEKENKALIWPDWPLEDAHLVLT